MPGRLAALSRAYVHVPALRRLKARVASLRAAPSQPPARRTAQTVVCREGWYYVLLSCMVFGAAMLREVNLMLILGGMMFGPLLFNWRLAAATLRGLSVRRTVPRGICAGDLLVVRLELANARRGLGSWAVSVRERIRREGNSSAGNVDVSEHFSYIPAGGVAARVYRGRLPQRGRYRWEPVQVSTAFPFGLFRREVLLGKDDTLLVFPRLGRLTQDWIKRRHEAFEGLHRREQRHSRVSGDFYGVREWRHGDSRRWIHWRSTARHGTLVVRQFERHRNRDVALLLDLWQPDEPSVEQRENVELAVSFAATVVADVCRRVGCNVLLGTAAPEPEFVGGVGSVVLLQDVMSRLALVEAACDDHLPRLLDETLRRVDPGTEVVIVSTRDVRLEDDRRFAPLWSDPQRRPWARRIRVVTTAQSDLERYFQAE
jgi:uncharacterized protein (DUF58 family)